MLPADERLDSGDLTGLQGDLRLIDQVELIALDRLTQFSEQGEPIPAEGVLAGGIDGITHAGFLGHVHGHVGATHEH